MAKLTPEQIKISQGWLHDLFVLAGLPNNNSSRDNDYYDSYYDSPQRDAAERIYDLLLNRPVRYAAFKQADKDLDTLSESGFSKDLNKYDYNTMVWKTPSMLARYLANFCARNKIYWDDTLNSPQEMYEIKLTNLGNALWEYECFITQPLPGAKVNTSNSKPTSSTSTSNTPKSTRIPGQPPQNSYKSLGGLSDKVPTLVGMPNNKKYINSSDVYCIEANKLGKNTPCIFVTPVSSSGQAVSNTKAATVNLGSGNGYSDCKLWWDSLSVAQGFLQDCQTKFNNSKFQNLHIAKSRPDSNGYFIVETEFGNAYIKASKLNEEILETLASNSTENDIRIEQKQKTSGKKSKLTNAYVINDIDTFVEHFNKD